MPSQAGAARGGAEALGERICGDRGLGGEWCRHGPNVAGVQGSSPGEWRVRRESVRGYRVDSTRHGP
ncbi:hypothetical protein STVIR_6073 [Streptomyces viridochromogenes Tue57]|uniref:Uncharacterized protein n=1 Tax=Streptomyces viridochromogenes Tue57 TaxID=1160705 RepID=L8P9Z5_STRVR|nr:hypothetical protein STVIR_6073 [Streptomyces viridochromogenes Tue57]